MQALDKALSSFNVHRQAYYGGTFIGNHVHRTLMVKLKGRWGSHITEVLQVLATKPPKPEVHSHHPCTLIGVNSVH